MANLKVSIVTRPSRSGFYLRYCEGSKPRWVKGGETQHEAEIAKIRLERKLKIEAAGGIVPEEPVVSPQIRSLDALSSYLEHLRTTTKPNGRRYKEKSVKEREAGIREFLGVVDKVYLSQIGRSDLIKYREYLHDKDLANDTVYNKLATVVTFMKKNQLLEMKSPLKEGDWPIVRKTKSHPFKPAEITAMLKVAGEHSLLIRLAKATGMRKGELMYVERSDVNEDTSFIRVQNKPYWGWETKTVAGERNIPLEESLWEELLRMPEGLLFPNKHGHPDIRIDRRFQEVGERAGVKVPVDDRACWCHRWRDTCATALVRSKTLSLLYIAQFLGHEDTSMLSIYTEGLEMGSPEAQAAAQALNNYGGKKPGLEIVNAA